MRPRIAPHVEHAIHVLALRKGISDQEMFGTVVDLGLAATRQPAAIMTPPMADWPEAADLPQALRAVLRGIADQYGENHERMAAAVVNAGLRALGADATALAEVIPS